MCGVSVLRLLCVFGVLFLCAFCVLMIVMCGCNFYVFVYAYIVFFWCVLVLLVLSYLCCVWDCFVMCVRCV